MKFAIIITIILLMFLVSYILYKWRQYKIQEKLIEQQEKEEEEQQKLCANDNYISRPLQKPIPLQINNDETTTHLSSSQQQDHNHNHSHNKTNTPIYNFVKSFSEKIMLQFHIDHAHREIFKLIYDYITENKLEKVEECDILFVVYSQCRTISVSKRLDIAVYLIWRSKNQEHIDYIYEDILSVASDKQENPKIRANALEILMRSNNNLYMDRSRRIMETLREHEKVQEMAHILKRMETIGNVMKKQSNGDIRQQNLTPYQQANQHINNPPPMTPEEIQVQQALLDEYRRLERRTFNAMNSKTVYDDTQNIHNHQINESVLQSVEKILQYSNGSTGGGIDIETELQKYYPDYSKHADKIKSSIQRIQSDPSKFRGNTKMSQVFDAVVSFISNSRNKQDLWKRMGEELVEMNQLCATGHLSRIVNVIQGFQDVPQEFQIKMDPKDEIYGNLSNYITKQIQESGQADGLLESMICPDDRSLFIGFVCIVLKPKVDELRVEYNGVAEPSYIDECIKKSIQKYLKNDTDTQTVLNSLSLS